MSLTNAKRDAMVAAGEFLKANGAHIGYQQVRPTSYFTKIELEITWNPPSVQAPTPVNVWDCSAFCAEICYLAGVKNPLGFSYASGDGDSATAGAFLQNYKDAIDAHKGAFLVFGLELPLGNQHMCMVTKPGKDPMVLSHGMPGVLELPLSQEAKAHPGASITFLDVSTL